MIPRKSHSAHGGTALSSHVAHKPIDPFADVKITEGVYSNVRVNGRIPPHCRNEFIRLKACLADGHETKSAFNM